MTGPVSVVVIGSSPLPPDSPTVAVGQGLAERLGGRYHLVVPAGAAEPGQDDLHPVQVHRVRARGRLGFLVAARQAVDRITPAKRQVLMSSNPLAALVAEGSALRRTAPHIFHLQGETIRPGPEYGGPLRRLALATATRMALRRASGVRVVSEHLRAAAAGWATGPVVVIGSRVDTRLFRPRERCWPTALPTVATATDTATGTAIGAGTESPVPTARHAVMVGGLAEVKNHTAVLRAWPGVLAGLPDARLTIAGAGPGRRRLEALVATLGLRRHVDLVGLVAHARVADLLASADCLLQPSWSEGQPRAVLEGMACGLPVICSDIPAHREIVPPGVGHLVPPHDPRLWTRAILATLGDPVGAAEMGRRGRALVVARHDLDAGLDRYAGFIAAIADRYDETGPR